MFCVSPIHLIVVSLMGSLVQEGVGCFGARRVAITATKIPTFSEVGVSVHSAREGVRDGRASADASARTASEADAAAA